MRNGYGRSLFSTEDGTCYLCGCQGDTARHEVLHGSSRQYAKKFGLWIAVCPRCHSLVHRSDNTYYLFLKEDAQRLFMDAYHASEAEFRSLFGRTYI